MNKIIIQSFGYRKSGVPNNSTLVFDVRSLPNPHEVTELRDLDGTSFQVAEWLLQFRLTNEIVKQIQQTVAWYAKNHDRNVVVSIGCYGGKHRSQFVAEYVAKRLPWLDIEVIHLEK